jgi:hypothetical protein
MLINCPSRVLMIGAWIFPGGDECRLVQICSHLPTPITGFGSSDCATRRSHLLQWSNGRALPWLGAGREDFSATRTVVSRACRIANGPFLLWFETQVVPLSYHLKTHSSLHRRPFLGGYVHDNRRATRRKESIDFESMSVRCATAHIQTPVS